MSFHLLLPAVKGVFLVCAFSCCAMWAPAQGVLNFTTLVAPGTAIGTNTATWTRISGNGFQAQLYIGPAETVDASLLTTNGVGGGPAFYSTGAQAGYVSGGTRVITGYAPGTTITVQLRAWNNGGGGFASWEDAPVGLRTAVFGFASPNLIQVTLGDPSGTAPALVGMNWYWISVPEPSTWALLALGGAVFAFRFRRKH